VSRLEQEVTEARVLAMGADHDVSVVEDALRAHVGTLNALRTTQLEQGQMIKKIQVEHGQRLDRLEHKVDDGFSMVDDRFKQIDGRFKQIDGRFKQIDDHFEQVDANFKTVEGEFSKLNTGMAHITALLTDKLGEPGAE
jgi:hypothetical protein